MTKTTQSKKNQDAELLINQFDFNTLVIWNENSFYKTKLNVDNEENSHQSVCKIEEYQNVEWERVQKILLLAELNWNSKGNQDYYLPENGLEIVRSVRSDNGCIAPIVVCSFLPRCYFFPNEAKTKCHCSQENCKGVKKIHFKCEDDLDDYIRKGRSFGVLSFCQLPFLLPSCLEIILNDCSLFNKQKTALEILAYYFSEEHNDHLSSLDHNLIKLRLALVNSFKKNDFLEERKKTWDATLPKLKAISSSYDLLFKESKAPLHPANYTNETYKIILQERVERDRIEHLTILSKWSSLDKSINCLNALKQLIDYQHLGRPTYTNVILSIDKDLRDLKKTIFTERLIVSCHPRIAQIPNSHYLEFVKGKHIIFIQENGYYQYDNYRRILEKQDKVKINEYTQILQVLSIIQKEDSPNSNIYWFHLDMNSGSNNNSIPQNITIITKLFEEGLLKNKPINFITSGDLDSLFNREGFIDTYKVEECIGSYQDQESVLGYRFLDFSVFTFEILLEERVPKWLRTKESDQYLVNKEHEELTNYILELNFKNVDFKTKGDLIHLEPGYSGAEMVSFTYNKETLLTKIYNKNGQAQKELGFPKFLRHKNVKWAKEYFIPVNRASCGDWRNYSFATYVFKQQTLNLKKYLSLIVLNYEIRCQHKLSTLNHILSLVMNKLSDFKEVIYQTILSKDELSIWNRSKIIFDESMAEKKHTHYYQGLEIDSSQHYYFRVSSESIKTDFTLANTVLEIERIFFRNERNTFEKIKMNIPLAYVHGDFHSGNILIEECSKNIYFIDFGNFTYTKNPTQHAFKDYAQLYVDLSTYLTDKGTMIGGEMLKDWTSLHSSFLSKKTKYSLSNPNLGIVKTLYSMILNEIELQFKDLDITTIFEQFHIVVMHYMIKRFCYNIDADYKKKFLLKASLLTYEHVLEWQKKKSKK